MSYKIKATVITGMNSEGKTETIATCTLPYLGASHSGLYAGTFIQLMLVARGDTKEVAVERLQQQLNELTNAGQVSSIEEIELDVPLPPTKAKD